MYPTKPKGRSERLRLRQKQQQSQKANLKGITASFEVCTLHFQALATLRILARKIFAI